MKPPASCPRLFPLRILARKWSYLILRALREPLSFAELRRELVYITNHILSRELQLLKEEQLITDGKKYALTASGKALYDAVEPLVRWSVVHTQAGVCAAHQKCAACLAYPAAVDVKSYIQLGHKAP